MARTASGRMINQDIALSAKVASLSPEALALFCLLIPHFNAHGKMLANPHAIKGNVCPLVEWLTVEKIGACLVEISEKTNVKWWQDEKGLHYLQSLNWNEHQDLRTDRLGADRLPCFPGVGQPDSPSSKTSPGPLPDNSRSNPGPLPPEVEVEGEGEEEGKRSSGTPYQKIVNLFHESCPSFPKIRAMGEQRKKTVRARWNQYAGDMETFQEVFTRAEASVFLQGENDRGWRADFDWLMNEANMVKVLEGKYDQASPGSQCSGLVGGRVVE